MGPFDKRRPAADGNGTASGYTSSIERSNGKEVFE